MPPVIGFDDVSKRYRLGSRLGDLREFVPDPFAAARHWWRRRHGNGDHHDEAAAAREVWALNDVSFKVEEGEALGVIGPNGAGKSTILKLLAGITEPTSGQIETRGRVSALIEVGAGFHPDLTGRENVYLNGSILGLTRREIDAKFDAIVEFAELDRFIDTPVKRYSSGMYVRLGFSVAMQLDPDLLLVDEVLAVGDARFRRKCIMAMRGFRAEARALLFVSHNMSAITGLCGRALWIDQGCVRRYGAAEDVTSEYLGTSRGAASGLDARVGAGSGVWGSGEILLREVELSGPGGVTESARTGERLTVRMVYESRLDTDDVLFWVCLVDSDGYKAAGANSGGARTRCRVSRGVGTVTCALPCLNIPPGHYSLTVGVFDRSGSAPFHRVGHAARVRVLPPDDADPAAVMGPDFDGATYLHSRWHSQQVDETWPRQPG